MVAETDLLGGHFASDEERPKAGVVEVGGGGAGLEGCVQLSHVDAGPVADEVLDA
ncbi:hypothetical protein ACFVH0_36060 [Streptomyces sp. NPDC127117]|uniref:hypothetical protein n=1 Tax=Streptomyces sp. NPDC127117 TaxID=3345368 RepID=UPI003626A2CA